VQWARRKRAAFGDGSFDEVVAALTGAGLQVCSVADEPDGLAGRAVASRAYEVAVDCPADTATVADRSDTATVVVDRFATVEDRDAAARRVESLVRPRTLGAVHTLGSATVYLPGSGDRAVRVLAAAAVRAAGAR
jgi:hypothetical protein